MSERVTCDRCGGGVDSAGECLRFPTQCKAAGYGRLESELREARAHLESWKTEVDGTINPLRAALSAERTAREKMQAEATTAQCAANEALAEVRRSQEALKRVRESLILFDSAVYGRARDYGGQILLMRQTVDAALAAEPGEGGPKAGGAEAIRRGEALAKGLEIILKQVVASLDDPLLSAEVEAKVNDFRAALNIPPEGHPRAAEVKNE